MAYTTINDPTAYFQVKAWTGTAATNALTFGGATAMAPDLVWIKNKSTAYDHHLYDTTRGVQKAYASNNAEAESTKTTGLTAFGSDGFTVGDDNGVNKSGDGIVACSWKESATSGFDIVQFEGNQTARTISHSLSAVPKFIVIKNREYNDGGHIYHVENGASCTMEVATTGGKNCSGVTGIWNDTTPTDSVFSVGDNGNINKTGDNIIVYLWAEKQGFSKFGKYKGNGTSLGPFVYTGFKPAWVMWKNDAAGAHWHFSDHKRSRYNGEHGVLKANANNTEYTGDAAESIHMYSNGWQATGSTNNNTNYSGNTYIYVAFAENPMVNSSGIPCNAR